jgi:hypothetical protein
MSGGSDEQGPYWIGRIVSTQGSVVIYIVPPDPTERYADVGDVRSYALGAKLKVYPNGMVLTL